MKTALPLPPVCLPVIIDGDGGDLFTVATGTGAPAAYHLPPAAALLAVPVTGGCGTWCGLSGYHVPPVVAGRAGVAQGPAENTLDSLGLNGLV